MTATPSTYHDVLIVGAGHAGAQAAIQLRQLGFTGSIGLLGAERHLPYERPPLSKDYLVKDRDDHPDAPDRLSLRPAPFWDDRAITLLTGHRVTTVDADAHRVTTTQGKDIGYGQLIWAAGASPRRLSLANADAPNVHVLRTRDDADRLRAAIVPGTHALVVGGGYIGLEAAAALVKRGARVTLVEQADRLLARVAGSDIGAYFHGLHTRHGVDIRLGHSLAALDVDARGMVTGATLADGQMLGCDLVVLGIGVIPEVGPLLSAGATGGDGVDVDVACRTALPDVFAIGDCALHANRYADGAMIRLESVQNAHDMARVAARGAMGEDAAYDALPWFWSNQYDARLQTVGICTGHDAAVVRGDPGQPGFSVVYLKDGRVIALDCVNAARDYVQGRALIEARVVPDRAALADPAVPLKNLVPAS